MCMCIEFPIQVLKHKNAHVVFLLGWYEARHDYTNNSETSLLCNRCACKWKITVIFEMITLISNSKTFQDGNGNGNFEEINSNDFLDGNWESMEMKGRLRGAKTVTVVVIHPNFKTVTVTVIFG